MGDPDQIVNQLIDWYLQKLKEIPQLEETDQIELLLSASEMGITGGIIANAVASIGERDKKSDLQNEPFLISSLRQLLFCHYPEYQAHIKRFLDYWFGGQRYKERGIFFASTIINIALRNTDLLEPGQQKIVRNWYLQHQDLKSDKIAAWAPYSLLLSGFEDQARKSLESFLKRREFNGSWGNDAKRTVSCLFAIQKSGILKYNDIHSTIDYLFIKYATGVFSDLSKKAQLLKTLHVLNLVPSENLERLRDKVANSGSIFISYSRKDSELADSIVRALEEAGFRIWIDRESIAGGDEWTDRLTNGINHSQVLLVLLSKNSISSSYCNKEILFAMKKNKPVVAVHLDDEPLTDKIELILGDIQRLKLHDYTDLSGLVNTVVKRMRS